jgi:hypothetical protein
MPLLCAARMDLLCTGSYRAIPINTLDPIPSSLVSKCSEMRRGPSPGIGANFPLGTLGQTHILCSFRLSLFYTPPHFLLLCLFIAPSVSPSFTLLQISSFSVFLLHSLLFHELYFQFIMSYIIKLLNNINDAQSIFWDVMPFSLVKSICHFRYQTKRNNITEDINLYVYRRMSSSGI